MNTDDTLLRVENKIDKLSDHISSIDTTLAKQSVILEEHVKRSTQLENRVDPLEKSHYMMLGVLKTIGILASIGAIAEGAVYVLNWLHIKG